MNSFDMKFDDMNPVEMDAADRKDRAARPMRHDIEAMGKTLRNGAWTKSQQDFFTLVLVHDLLPWREEAQGMTLREIRRALAGLGLPLTDRQLRYCLARGADVLLMDIDHQAGRKQYWKRVDPAPLCARLRTPPGQAFKRAAQG